MTAFTHASSDGKYLCVPMTDGRCLDFDPKQRAQDWTKDQFMILTAAFRREFK